MSGEALDLVMTYQYEPADDGCVVTLTVKGAGAIEEGWAAAVDGAWHHFLLEQLKPYVESGRHKH